MGVAAAEQKKNHGSANSTQLQSYVARVDYLESKMAEVLPAIDKFMQNVNRSWTDLKQRAETAERQLAEIDKRIGDLHQRLNEVQRSVALDIRGVELSWQSDLLSLRQALDDARRKKELTRVGS